MAISVECNEKQDLVVLEAGAMAFVHFLSFFSCHCDKIL